MSTPSSSSTTTRSGDFAPFVSSPKERWCRARVDELETADVEDADEVKKRIDEAAEYVPLGQLALSHQCGFSSTVHGNKLTPDDQWRKLARTVEMFGVTTSGVTESTD